VILSLEKLILAVVKAVKKIRRDYEDRRGFNFIRNPPFSLAREEIFGKYLIEEN